MPYEPIISMSVVRSYDSQPTETFSGSGDVDTGSIYFNKESGSVYVYDGELFVPIGGMGGTGTSGTSGAAGSSGTSGASGAAGSSGTSGASGAAGSSGTSGTSGQTGDRYSTTSNSSVTIGSGAKSFTLVDTDLSYIPGQQVIASFDDTRYMIGSVTSYDTGTNILSVNVTSTGGSGTYMIWSVSLNGAPGPAGTSGTSGQTGSSGTSGQTGSSGTSGQTGSSGTSGQTGSSGTSGQTGSSGTSGQTGSSGTSGQTGSSGTSGVSGGSTTLSGSIHIVLYNGGTDLTTGIKDTPVMIPYSGSSTGWDIMAYDSTNTLTSTSTVVDILSDSFANLPLAGSDSIAGTEKPTLSAQSTNQDTSLTTWSQLVAGNYLQAEIESISSGVAKLVIDIKVERI